MTCTVPVFGSIRGEKKIGSGSGGGEMENVQTPTVRPNAPVVNPPTVRPPQAPQVQPPKIKQPQAPKPLDQGK